MSECVYVYVNASGWMDVGGWFIQTSEESCPQSFQNKSTLAKCAECL